MAWIKRNLYFVIGCLVAVGLMGWAGWYLYSKMSLNNSVREQLTARYAELDALNKLDPHPGDGKKVDNIEIAGEQQQVLRDFIKKANTYFEKIPAIPDTPKVRSEDFGKQLRNTIDQLSHDAINWSVTLPPKYNFTFEAQKPLMTFASGSLEPLAVKLGEINAICDVLFRARINALEGMRRERVSTDDSSTTAGIQDYLDQKSVTNELAVLTPYEVTFRSFSSELAAVMAGLANSPHCFIIKTIAVEPAPEMALPNEPAATPIAPIYPTTPFPSPFGGGKDASERMRFQERYGLKRPPPQIAVAPPPTPTTRGGLPTAINERPLKVTLLIQVVKLKDESKESKPKPRKPATTR